jgi:formylglycine-generating enzyme required for sulfatase activity
LRGGDWFYPAEFARSANRGYGYPGYGVGDGDFVGFRCVRGL